MVGGGRWRTRRSASLPASSRPMDRTWQKFIIQVRPELWKSHFARHEIVYQKITQQEQSPTDSYLYLFDHFDLQAGKSIGLAVRVHPAKDNPVGTWRDFTVKTKFHPRRTVADDRCLCGGLPGRDVFVSLTGFRYATASFSSYRGETTTSTQAWNQPRACTHPSLAVPDAVPALPWLNPSFTPEMSSGWYYNLILMRL